MQMSAHGTEGNAEFIGNFLIEKAFGKQGENLTLPPGKFVYIRCRRFNGSPPFSRSPPL